MNKFLSRSVNCVIALPQRRAFFDLFKKKSRAMPSPMHPVTTTYHGIPRTDNFQWLEIKGSTIESYLKSENQYAEEVMANSAKLQQQLFQEIRRRELAEVSSNEKGEVIGNYKYRLTDVNDCPYYMRQQINKWVFCLLAVGSLICSLVCSFVCSFVSSLVCLLTCSVVPPRSFRSFVCFVLCSFVRSFVRFFVRSSIRSLLYASMSTPRLQLHTHVHT
jgi:hypothetical protein